MKQLFRDNAEVAGKDYVELFLEQLPDDSPAGSAEEDEDRDEEDEDRDEEDEDRGEEDENSCEEDEDSDEWDCDEEVEAYIIIVEDGLHGSTFDKSYDEFNREVSESHLEQSTNLTC